MLKKILNACKIGSKEDILNIMKEEPKKVNFIVCEQDEKTGISPLMMAAKFGNIEICELLLEKGAPWNAIDRYGKCAGNYASDAGHQNVVDLLVDAGVKAEFILSASHRLQTEMQEKCNKMKDEKENERPVEHEPCTKPDYLTSHNVRYNPDHTSLLDEDGDAVMMEWERPLMKAHASIITKGNESDQTILNVGFGMGIIDTILQETKPKLHVIIEAHPIVYKNMIDSGWDKKDNVRICFGKWQDEILKLLEEKIRFDGIFFDTYGEHFLDLEDFHNIVPKLIQKPNGIYSFFNGLAPDNIFFHGVGKYTSNSFFSFFYFLFLNLLVSALSYIACQCVKLQLAKFGLDTEFASCEIKVDESAWNGVRRKYWHGDTYYLPIVTWSQTKNLENSSKKQKLENDT